MKNNLLTSVFSFLLCLSTLFSCWVMYKYNNATHRIQAIRPEAEEVNRVMGLMQSLLFDINEYNRTAKNPEMTRLLQSVGTTQKSTIKSSSK